MDDTDNPALEHAIDEHIAAALGPRRGPIPARIVDYDKVTQTATVQVIVRSRYLDDDGNIVAYLPKPIANVPVQWPAASGISITFPLVKDDEVTLIFADRSLDEWKHNGGSDNTPEDPRRWDLTDAVCLPGKQSPSRPLPSAAVDDDALVIRAPMTKIGSSAAAKAVALSPEVEAYITSTLIAQLATHTHPDPITGLSGPPMAVFTAPTTGQLAASKLKAE